MKLFSMYLKDHLKGMVLFIIFTVIFSAVFALYQIPVEAVLYAALLCSFVGAVLLTVNFMSYYARHQRLVKLFDDITVTMDEMPAPKGMLEEDYQHAIEILYDDKARIVSEHERRYAETIEYYTVWVHQIKTPIAAMRLLLQGRDSRNKSLEKEIEHELQRIEQYVEMVLCYLRLDSEQTDYVIKEYSIDSIVKQAVRKFANQFIYKKIRLEYDELNFNVLTDEKWLLFVMEQVLSNALKYTKTGSITIYMDETDTLCIRDTGIGIASEDVGRVFERGFTGYNGRKDKKATGLGLYLCSRIIKKLGHRISIESEAGEGTIVRIGLGREKYEIYS